MSTQRYFVTPHPIENPTHLGEVWRNCDPRDSAPLRLGGNQGSQPARLALPGLSCGLPDCLAQPHGEAEGRHAVGRQANPDRWTTARDCADGGATGPRGADQRLRDGPHPHRLPPSGRTLRGREPSYPEGRGLDRGCCRSFRPGGEPDRTNRYVQREEPQC